MKITLTILACIFIALIALSGCGQKMADKNTAAAKEIPAAKLAANATASEPAAPTPSTSVTKSELDKLKSDLEGMQFDNLEGLK